MREELNRILRLESFELPDEDPTRLLQMLSVKIGELSSNTSMRTNNTADIAVLAGRALRHLLSMIPVGTETDTQSALRRKIVSNLDSVFSRHIPGIAPRFEQDRKERALIFALSQLSDQYRNIPREWLPYTSQEADWHAFAVSNLSELLDIAHRIASRTYQPVLNNFHNLLSEYAAIRNVA